MVRSFKETKVKLELPADSDILLTVEKAIRGRLCHSINSSAEANNKYMKDYNKNKGSSYLKYWDVNNLYGWSMSQKLSVSGFKWVEDFSEFNEDFIKNYSEKSNEEYFIKVDVQFPENLHELHNDLPFLPKINKTDKVKNFVADLRDTKRIYYAHKKSKKNIKCRIIFEKKFTKSLNLIKKLG